MVVNLAKKQHRMDCTRDKVSNTTPGFHFEFSTQKGPPQNDSTPNKNCMAQLLTRFALPPASDGWHSYGLMEIMAMSVVPIVLADNWHCHMKILY